MTYTAPVKDIAFVLNHVVDLAGLAKLEGFEDATPDLIAAILEESAKFTADVLAPLNWSGDQQGSQWQDGEVTTPDGWRDAYNQFIESGWGSLAFPPEFGGQGLPMTVAAAVQEMWHSANMSFGLCPLLTQGAVDAIEHHASEELRQRYLPKMVEGVWSGTMNLTEPQAGSDLAAVRTKAEPAGDHYLVSGQKIYITYGEHDLTENIIHLVLARLPDAPAGVKGISLFIVPKFLINDDGSLGERNDVTCVSIEHKLGIHASPTCVMSYGDKGGAIGYLVGKENHGLAYMFTMMNQARHAVGVEGYGIAERAYQQALSYARDRKQGKTLLGQSEDDQGIINHPDVRRMLMTMRSTIEAMRGLGLECAAAFDQARRDPDEAVRERMLRRGELLTPLVKGWSTEMGVELCSLGVQVHGGMGYIEETGAAQYLRDSRIVTIYEGTTAIQANDLIGRKTARDGGKGLGELMSDMRTTVAELKALDDVELQSVMKRLETAISAAESATAWLLEQKDASLPAAVSVEFLMMQGRLAGGWMLARGALAATGLKQNADADVDYLNARIAVARYYAERTLPLVESAATIIIEGAESTIALDTAQL
ncbi:acyl-CoA dehydrogenase [Granulosicoccus antarcticus]|uniref:3-methylmercaptopropionyl-CoA dehydrogenase n=1 Tax=Granulosicoccus antarcticus IMCC3135 TaxID=1192854 RepID=A0A2Z2NZW2_9GAMM|nr:acyl-CoA dehydrogenase [Granulosicoccus antarcticus]ASJ75501.1 3-methylmercaptopropionyl-CoA dehydrogenase [Granulosicoccus antarcticus IMCC3135]